MDEEHLDFYRRLRGRVEEWAGGAGQLHRHLDILLAAPDFFYLLLKLSGDPDVPKQEKVKLLAAIIYFVTPLDLFPEALFGPVGYLDDTALAAYVLSGLVNRTDPEVVRRHWAGSGDVLEVIQRVLDVANSMIGSGLWKRLRGIADRF
jgi:uncharacterized membrane protein YkvA (DUF1232 family)